MQHGKREFVQEDSLVWNVTVDVRKYEQICNAI
jgi:hypothetical protein